MHTERTSEQPSRRHSDRHHRIAEAAAHVLERAREPGAVSSRGLLPAELREAILLLCAAAHAEHLTVERLIVVLKETWATLPGVRLSRGGEKDTALTCVITQCILDFYTPGPHADSAWPRHVNIHRTRGDST